MTLPARANRITNLIGNHSGPRPKILWRVGA
jgi:hypothetical protein